MHKNKSFHGLTQSLQGFKVLSVALLLLTLGACAHHPKKPLPLPPPSPAPSLVELESAQRAAQSCLDAQAYKLDDGVSSPAALGPRVAWGCLNELHVFGVLQARRTRDTAGAWVLYQTTMNGSDELGAHAIAQLRKRVASH
jgi:predicted small lipoprotein YifL